MIFWFNITTIVYGASIEETEKLGKIRTSISNEELIQKAPVNMELIKDILKEECLDFYKAIA